MLYFFLLIPIAYYIHCKIQPKRIPGIPHLDTTERLFGDLRPLLTHFRATKKFVLYYEQLSAKFPGGPCVKPFMKEEGDLLTLFFLQGYVQFSWLAWQPYVLISDPFLIESSKPKEPIPSYSNILIGFFVPKS